jgi:uncharacterized damage-inducible protein DinB
LKIQSMLIITALAGAVALNAQNPLSAEVKASYTGVKNNLIRAAEKMPEENYSFKPTPEVQTWAQRVAHIADANAGGCGRVKGEAKQLGAASKTSKADLVAALKESFAYCDAVFDGMTDADAVTTVSGGRGPARSKLALLWGAVAHSNEIYGAMGVYMRLKGIVPPSSEPRN